MKKSWTSRSSVPRRRTASASFEPAAGAADLLVVGDRRARALEVDDEAEVGLVVAHAEGAGRDDALDLVAEQHPLDPDPVVGFDLAGVGLGLDPVLVEPVGDVVGVADGQAVDDAAALELRDVGGEPGHPLGLARHVADLEPQRRPVEGAADRDQVPFVAGFAVLAGAELLGDVGDHAVVGRRGRAEDGGGLGQALDEAGDPPVVGAEVVAPVGDAVGLVDDEQAGGPDQLREDVAAEVGIGEALGAEQQQVDLAVIDLLERLLPVLAVGGVDRGGVDAERLGRLELVAHQGDQRRDEDRRPGALLAQHRGGDEVDGALPPPGPLHAEDAAAALDDLFDRLELTVAELGAAVAGQAAEQVDGGRCEGGRCFGG